MNSGSLAMFAAMRRSSSRVSNRAAACPRDSHELRQLGDVRVLLSTASSAPKAVLLNVSAGRSIRRLTAVNLVLELDRGRGASSPFLTQRSAVGRLALVSEKRGVSGLEVPSAQAA